jgi:hypothetical protein
MRSIDWAYNLAAALMAVVLGVSALYQPIGWKLERDMAISALHHHEQTSAYVAGLSEERREKILRFQQAAKDEYQRRLDAGVSLYQIGIFLILTAAAGGLGFSIYSRIKAGVTAVMQPRNGKGYVFFCLSLLPLLAGYGLVLLTAVLAYASADCAVISGCDRSKLAIPMIGALVAFAVSVLIVELRYWLRGAENSIPVSKC